MRTRKHFQIGEMDWAELVQLSKTAHQTPVIATADAMAGRLGDLTTQARKRVLDHWRILGTKYGFDGGSVEPIDEPRTISAYPADEPNIHGE